MHDFLDMAGNSRFVQNARTLLYKKGTMLRQKLSSIFFCGFSTIGLLKNCRNKSVFHANKLTCFLFVTNLILFRQGASILQQF